MPSVEFSVSDRRFELRLREVISGGVVGFERTCEKKLVAHVRLNNEREEDAWVKVPNPKGLNFDTSEEALAAARQFVEDNPARLN